jgi:hypothetical protein
MREFLHRAQDDQEQRHPQNISNSSDNEQQEDDKVMQVNPVLKMHPGKEAPKMSVGKEKIQMMTNTSEGVKSEEDRSVLQIKTFPWKGTISSKGNSSIGLAYY